MTTHYRNSPRLVSYGHFGSPDYSPLCLCVRAEAVFTEARKRGDTQGFEMYGEGDRAHIALRHDLYYFDDWNRKTNWSQMAGSSNNFLQLGGPIAAFAPILSQRLADASGRALCFNNCTLDITSLFVTTAQVLSANAPFTLRLVLQKPDEAQFYSRFFAQWGQWRFLIEKGSASMVRLADGYTEALDYERMRLLNTKNVSTADQVRANEIEALIYADRKSINKVGSEDWYEAAHDVTFIPSAHGAMYVIIEGEGAENATEVTDSRKANLRTASTMWGASRIMVGANGGAYAWQLAKPVYAVSGTFSLPNWPAQRNHDPGDIAVTLRFEANGDSNAIAGSVAEYPNEAFNRLEFAFTSDGTTSPTLYGAQAFDQGGGRSGSSAVKLDTSLLATSTIIDVEPHFDLDNKRTSVQVTLRNINGAISSAGYPGLQTVDGQHSFLHDCLADVSVNGTTLVAKGLITSSTVADPRKADTSGTGGAAWAMGDTRHIFNISDLWEVAERLRLKRQPIGDGMKLGAYLRLVLGMMGFTDSDVSGISATGGRTLPEAAFGEPPCVQPTLDSYGGDFLRRLIETYGNGLELTCWSGVWKLAAPDTSTIKARFSSSASWSDRTASPPIYRVMNKAPDLTIDFSDFYNLITVVGGKDERGVPIVKSWVDHESIHGLNTNPRYLGYEKAYQTVIDESLRTPDEVQMAVRNLFNKYSQGGRFFSFESWWVDGVHPGDLVQVDGINWVVTRISGASAKGDRMSFVVREVVQAPGELVVNG